jgi:Holliday junction resolvasome RuvABC endonuclease subunit
MTNQPASLYDGQGRSRHGIVLLGLDPSINGYGWVFAESARPGHLEVKKGGVIKVPALKSPAKRRQIGQTVADAFDARLGALARGLSGVLAEGADLAVFEQAAGGNNRSGTAWKSVGAAHGVTRGVCAALDLRTASVTAKEIKRATAGRGSSKNAVEAAMRRLVPSLGPVLEALPKSKREHVADACAALWVWTGKEVLR